MKKLIIFVLFSTISGISYASIVPQLTCLGTEPFWDIKTDINGILSMSDPWSEKKEIYSKTVLKNANGMAAGYAFQIEAKDDLDNTLKLNVIKADCSDGMSEIIYPYNVLVDVSGRIYFGCCR